MSAFWDSVHELAKLRKFIPKEQREMSGVPRALTPVKEQSMPGTRIIELTTRPCPACGKRPLKPVYGTDERMGRCPKCGWTGPMREDDD